jgi:hypothetical protein
MTCNLCGQNVLSTDTQNKVLNRLLEIGHSASSLADIFDVSEEKIRQQSLITDYEANKIYSVATKLNII